MISLVAYHLDNIATFQSCRLNIKGRNYKPVNIQLVTDDQQISKKVYQRTQGSLAMGEILSPHYLLRKSLSWTMVAGPWLLITNRESLG